MNPCYKCQDRRAATKDAPSCHATCEKYLAWKAAWVEKNHFKPDPAKELICETALKIKRHKQKLNRRKTGGKDMSMIYLTIIAVLLVALAGSLCGNLWLAGELERIQREGEMDWGDPEVIRDMEVPHE